MAWRLAWRLGHWVGTLLHEFWSIQPAFIVIWVISRRPLPLAPFWLRYARRASDAYLYSCCKIRYSSDVFPHIVGHWKFFACVFLAILMFRSPSNLRLLRVPSDIGNVFFPLEHRSFFAGSITWGVRADHPALCVLFFVYAELVFSATEFVEEGEWSGKSRELLHTRHKAAA